jgi:hypothetical protein
MADVVVSDKVWREIQKKVAKAATAHVRVGVLSSKGGDADHGEGISMVELAAIHEFGAPRAGIPERSFIRRTFAKKARETAAMTKELARAVVLNKLSVAKALDVLGVWGAAAVRETITQGSPIPPPLAASTVAKKGSTRSLVDTGRLVGAIQHEVVT